MSDVSVKNFVSTTSNEFLDYLTTMYHHSVYLDSKDNFKDEVIALIFSRFMGEEKRKAQMEQEASKLLIQQQQAEDNSRKKGLASLRETLRRDPIFSLAGKEIDFGDPESIPCRNFRVKFRRGIKLSVANSPYGGFETMLVHDRKLLEDTQLFFNQDETNKIVDYIFWIYVKLDTLKMTSEDLHKIIKKISPKIADFYRDEKIFYGIDILIHSTDFFLDALSEYSEKNNYNVCKQERRIAECFRRLRGCDKLSFLGSYY